MNIIYHEGVFVAPVARGEAATAPLGGDGPGPRPVPFSTGIPEAINGFNEEAPNRIHAQFFIWKN